jgi:pSer/pThr/pTyr-binding forkhead associated (FHA) protein
VRNSAGPTPTTTNTTRSTDHDSSSDHATEGTTPQKHLPSIRFIPHQDPRAGRPSLQFPTITRTLPDESAIIRVGRYSERDNAPEIPANTPSAAAIGFKSKVVSRKHCELWCKDGNWFVKDVKSSSGTFLNHIRLSQPNVESKPFRIKDGDIIQLGIDFRGGEEMIFRCVKIRVECNRGWQQALNTFNKQTHQRLRNLTKTKKEGDSASTHTSECAICLMSIAVSFRVLTCEISYSFTCTALPVTIRSALLARLALQVHPSHPKRAHMAQLPLPKL